MTLVRPNAVRDPFRRNAYRVLGLAGEASWGEMARSAERLRGLESWGAWSSPWDLKWLGTVRREPSDVDAALARLNDSTRRLVDRFFWFHERDSESAVAYLTPSSIRDALEGWSTTTLPIAKHDAAVVGLLAAVTMDEDVEDPDLWARVLREWTSAIGRDDYWLEVMRVEMEGGFEAPASLGDLRDLRDGALGHVAGVLLDRAREAVIDGDGGIATRAIAVLHDELPPELFDALCGELSTHLWRGALPARRSAAPAPAPPEAPPAPHAWPPPETPPAPHAWPPPEAAEAPEAEPGATIDPWRRAEVRRDESTALPEPAAVDPPTRFEMREDPRDARTPREPEPVPAEPAAFGEDEEPPPDRRRAMSAHMSELRAAAGGRPPARLAPETEVALDPPAPLPPIPSEPPLSTIAEEPIPPPAPPPARRRRAGGRHARPVTDVVATPDEEVPSAEGEPEGNRRLPRIPRRVIAGAVLAAAIATIALLAPWPQSMEPRAPVAATATGDPVRATLILRIEAADQAIAGLLVERTENLSERGFLRRTIEDYWALVNDYHWRMAHGLPYDPTGYRRVRGYLEDDLSQYRAASSEARVVADRYDALIRERSSLVAQYNERVR